jgi:hypothetical protein
MTLLYAWADRSWAAGPERLTALLKSLTSIPPYPTDPLWEYAWTLGIAMGPALLLIPFGAVCALREKNDATTGLAVVTLAVLLAQTVVIGHKEIRYLLPIATGLAWFAAIGFDRLVDRIPPRATAILIGLLLIVPGAQLVRTAIRLADPVYHEPFIEGIARTIRDAHLDGRPIYWNGNTHPIAPADFIFSRYDEYYAVWHFGIPDWYLATGTNIRHVGDLPPDVFLSAEKAPFFAKERALVVIGRRTPYYTSTLTKEGKPPPVTLLWYDAGSSGYDRRLESHDLPGW